MVLDEYPRPMAEHLGQPVAEVLAYLHVQISLISCNVVGSILHVLGKNLLTCINFGAPMTEAIGAFHFILSC